MSISVEFAPEVEIQINREAVLHGSSPGVYIREIVEKALLATPIDPVELRRKEQSVRNASSIALLDKWRLDGEAAWAQMTPEERNQEESDWEILQSALDENRRCSGEYCSPLP